LVADAAIEGGDGAVFWSANVADQGCGVDALAHQKEQIVIGWRGQRGHKVLPAADGGQKGDFVAGVERGLPSSKFLIA
jgi:hypothetical protein